MTPSVFIVCLLAGSAAALVNLDCSDNATCIESLPRDLVRNLRANRAVKLFDAVTIEPVDGRQARSREGLWKFVQGHAVSFDWNDFTFRLTVPKDGRDDALELEMYEGRSAKEVSDTKSSSKVEDETEEDKAPVRRIRRRQKKKVLQALVPLLFGMKSAGVVIFAFAIVSALTIKAFVASKMALMVTIGMAAKKLYESYSTGVGLQNHPYLYSQYPIDFPSASSHAYSVAGVSPQFASQEMYSPTALGAHTHSHEMLQSQDASAQQSQQAPLLVNSTNAAERWDGKSTILKYLEPIIDKVKTFINPIANVFYGAMPTAMFRGLNSDASTAKSVEAEPVEEIKKPKEFLIPQPRFIAQRKTFRKTPNRPKKHVELKIDLDRLKHNKDLHDYVKTKKYKYNYPNTFYYPRVKYVVNPNTFYAKPNNSRLIPYNRKLTNPTTSTITTTTESTTLPFETSDWRPIVAFNETSQPNATVVPHKLPNFKPKRVIRRFFRKSPNIKRRKRIKRDLSNFQNDRLENDIANNDNTVTDKVKSEISHPNEGRGFIYFFFPFMSLDPVSLLFNSATKTWKGANKVHKKEPLFYSFTYNLLMTSLDVIDGIFNVGQEVHNHYFDFPVKKSNPKKKRKKDKKKNKCQMKMRKRKRPVNQNGTNQPSLINNETSSTITNQTLSIKPNETLSIMPKETLSTITNETTTIATN